MGKPKFTSPYEELLGKSLKSMDPPTGRRYELKFRVKEDADIIRYLDRQSNIHDAMRKLIRREIRRNDEFKTKDQIYKRDWYQRKKAEKLAQQEKKGD